MFAPTPKPELVWITQFETKIPMITHRDLIIAYFLRPLIQLLYSVKTSDSLKAVL